MKSHRSIFRNLALLLLTMIVMAISGASRSEPAEEVAVACESGVRLASRAVQVPTADHCPPLTNGRFVVSGVLEIGGEGDAATVFIGDVTPPSGARAIMCSCPVSGCRAEWFACEGYGGPNGCAACCSEGCGLGPLSTHYDYCIGN